MGSTTEGFFFALGMFLFVALLLVIVFTLAYYGMHSGFVQHAAVDSIKKVIG